MKDGFIKAKPIWSFKPIFWKEFIREGAYLRDSINKTDRGLMSHDTRLCGLENQVRILQEEIKKLQAKVQ
jgi:vacuolar-type H+-ATPase subunit D/Vma8